MDRALRVKVHACDARARAALPAQLAGFLGWLSGPAALRVPGADRSRTRMVSTLLHGNEPSGAAALHAWLLGAERPAVDALLVFANVEAALAPPGFAHRMLPGRRDLNRCFGEAFDDQDGRLAQQILRLVRETKPEALIDIHNNSGHNPPYAVASRVTPEALQLASLFADRFVHSTIELGALTERLLDVPGVTIEAGRSGDPAATAAALSGLRRFFGEDPILVSGATPRMRVLTASLRVCVRPHARLAVGARPVEGADATIEADLDRHNFEGIQPGTPIGWTRASSWPIELRDPQGRDLTDAYLARDGERIRVRRSFVPIMITTDPVAAANDCLFYVAEESEALGRS